MALQPISQKQALITISGVEGKFTSKKGGKVSREEVKYNDGQQGLEQTFVGFLSIENLTLQKPFDPAADKNLAKWCADQIANPTPFNIAVQPVKADLAGTTLEGSGQLLYSNCTLSSYMLPDFDRNGSGLALIELTVVVNSLPTYV